MNDDHDNFEIFFQVVDVVDIGLLILDKELRICHWNRWMQSHSDIDPEAIKGSVIFDVFPNLKQSLFINKCKAIFTFGNFCFFSQKIHHYLFPFKPVSLFDSQFDFMKQNCTVGPLRNKNGSIEYIFIAVYDVTETVNLEQKLMEMNNKDALTGVHNRLGLEMKLKEEVKRNKHYGHPLSIIMFDIDYFQKVNDTYGVQCGDFILQQIASTIEKSIKSQDIIARYGEDVFCCILPETAIEGAETLAERFRKKIAEEDYNYLDKNIKVTISLGVSTLGEETNTAAMLSQKAAAALSSAKNIGRNRVVVEK
jgi:diguanylate cyclase (GGDEF)-like protein